MKNQVRNPLIAIFVALFLVSVIGLSVQAQGPEPTAVKDIAAQALAHVSGVREYLHDAGAEDLNVAAPTRPSGVTGFDDSGFPDIKVNRDYSNFPQDETVIAVNPRNSANLIAGANDYRLGYGLSGFYASFDEGRTWEDGLVPIAPWPTGDVPAGGGDPVVAFDSEGVAYYAQLHFDRATARDAVIVNRSYNGGRTWSRACFGRTLPTGFCTPGDGVVSANTVITDGRFSRDKEWMAIGRRPAGAPLVPGSNLAWVGRDRIYVTWTRFTFNITQTVYFGSPIYEAHSDDQGRHWSAPQEINGSTNPKATCVGASIPNRCYDNQFSVPVVDRNGTVYVFFYNYDTPAENQYLIVKSTDGGATWQPPVKITTIFDQNYPLAGSGSGGRNRPDCTDRGQGSFRQVLSNSCFRVNSAGNGAVGPDGSLYLVWSDNRNGTNTRTDTDIFVSWSRDGGSTWSAPVMVNNDKHPGTRNNKDQWFPWVTVAEDGAVYVVFHDRRMDTFSERTAPPYNVPISPPGNYLIDTFIARSLDGGRTWANLRVTPVQSNFDYSFRGGVFAGDYNGIAVGPTTVYPFYTDAFSGTADVAQSDVYVAGIPR